MRMSITGAGLETVVLASWVNAEVASLLLVRIGKHPFGS